MVLGAAHRSFDFLFSGAVSDHWAARHCSYGEEMNDRELLEMAAKAAGICGHYACHHPKFDNDWEELGIWFVDKNDCTSCWNPLQNDGDALRLALKITRDFEPYRSQGFGWIIGKTNEEVRRAIVRAAAELGKEMK